MANKGETMKALVPLRAAAVTLLAIAAGCGGIDDNEDDNQPARLISTVPADGEHVDLDGFIHLCFDKPVRHVAVNDYAARNRHGKLSNAAWEIPVNRLELYDKYIGFHPDKLVQLEITFEDDAGRHRVKLNVRRGALHTVGSPLVITGGNVHNGAKNVDPELHNTHGIQFSFSDNIEAGTVVLRPKDGSPLNWIAEWRRNLVTLYPPNGNRLQHGTEYILEIIGVRNGLNEYNFEIRFTTKD